MSVLWQVGWVIGGMFYAGLQATLGFDAGYAINFVTIITLYTIATDPLLDVVPGRRPSRLRGPPRRGLTGDAPCRRPVRGVRRGPAPVDFGHGRGPAPQRAKTAIPRNPGRTELGMQATLLFPDQGHRRAVLRAAHLHGLPDVLLGARPAGDLPQGDGRRDRPGLDAAADPERHRVGPRLHHRARRVHVRASAACRGRCRTSSCATGRASRSTSRASAT